jgi:xylulokinase
MYLTFDVGTTSVKTALFNRNGKLVHKTIRDYSLDSPQVDWYELDPEKYWSSVMDGFQEILGKSDVKASEIVSISGCSQGETFILLDEHDHYLRPAIVWYDNRARREVEEIAKIVDNQEFYHTTGLTEMETTWSMFKLLWVKRNEPEVFSRIRKVLLVEDFIIYKLTGQYITSKSLNCSTGFLNIHKGSYWEKTVNYVGLEDLLPPIIKEGSIVEKVNEDVANALGINSNVVVVKGAMDQITSAVGAGNIRPGIVTETTGSAMAVVVTMDEIIYDEHVEIPYQPHIIPGKQTLLPYAQTSGIVYKWFKENVISFTDPGGSSIDIKFDTLNTRAASVPAGSEGMVFLPFLAGAHFPENNTAAKGVFYGITLKHTQAHFCRVIMESIGYMLRKIIEPVKAFGIEVEEIHSMGGAARSDLWLQIKSDICNCPIVRMEEEETSTLGAAIIASVQVGDYSSVDEAVKAMVKKGKRFEPQNAHRHVYDRSFELYTDIYNNLKDTFTKYSS